MANMESTLESNCHFCLCSDCFYILLHTRFNIQRISSFDLLLCDWQIYGDPEAADVVFTSGANIEVIGINITTQVQLTG